MRARENKRLVHRQTSFLLRQGIEARTDLNWAIEGCVVTWRFEAWSSENSVEPCHLDNPLKLIKVSGWCCFKITRKFNFHEINNPSSIWWLPVAVHFVIKFGKTKIFINHQSSIAHERWNFCDKNNRKVSIRKRFSSIFLLSLRWLRCSCRVKAVAQCVMTKAKDFYRSRGSTVFVSFTRTQRVELSRLSRRRLWRLPDDRAMGWREPSKSEFSRLSLDSSATCRFRFAVSLTTRARVKGENEKR